MYGSRAVLDEHHIYTPFEKNKYVNLLQKWALVREDLLRFREEWPEYAPPYPVFPEPGGLLLWGGDGNGDELHWLTIGEPDEWTVVVHYPRGGNHETYPMTMTQLLLALVRDEVRSDILPTALR